MKIKSIRVDNERILVNIEELPDATLVLDKIDSFNTKQEFIDILKTDADLLSKSTTMETKFNDLKLNTLEGTDI